MHRLSELSPNIAAQPRLRKIHGKNLECLPAPLLLCLLTAFGSTHGDKFMADYTRSLKVSLRNSLFCHSYQFQMYFIIWWCYLFSSSKDTKKYPTFIMIVQIEVWKLFIIFILLPTRDRIMSASWPVWGITHCWSPLKLNDTLCYSPW